MTRVEALESVARLAVGLPCDHSGETRLAELVAGHDEAEALRAVLVEAGIRSVLDGPHPSYQRPSAAPTERAS